MALVANHTRPPETTSCQALTLQKFDFSSKYISSIEVQCGELTALSTWSKWPPAIYLLVRTILHGAGLLIMIARPNLLCRTSMITPCQLGIQKLHLHWKYPSGSGIYSHTVRHFPAASPSTAKRSTVESTLFIPWRNHRVTWITWPPLWRSPHSPNSEIFTAPEQYVFHSDGERR